MLVLHVLLVAVDVHRPTCVLAVLQIIFQMETKVA